MLKLTASRTSRECPAAREHERAGIRAGELGDVGAAVLATLGEKGPLTTAALRAALPDGKARGLGADGKKVGISSTLPPALRRRAGIVRGMVRA